MAAELSRRLRKRKGGQAEVAQGAWGEMAAPQAPGKRMASLGLGVALLKVREVYFVFLSHPA